MQKNIQLEETNEYLRRENDSLKEELREKEKKYV